MMGTTHNFRMSDRRPAYPVRGRGFTLTELLVVVGLFVVLMIAVSAIFTSTSKAVGTGQAISDGMRDLRAAEAIIDGDMAHLKTSGTPFLIITNRRESAFANANDAQTDQDYNPNLNTSTAANRVTQETQIRTFDPTATGTELEYSPVLLNTRSHRVDQIQFFAEGRFVRQTGNDGTYVAPMTSNEAFITYGHVRQPDNAGYYRGLGSDFFTAQLTNVPMLTFAGNPPPNPPSNANQNNFYASQWILGRRVVLLNRPNPATGLIDDNSGVHQQYYWANTGANALYPLALGAPATINGAAASVPLQPVQDARYDLAGTTIRDYRLAINGEDLLTHPWWVWFDYRSAANLFPARPIYSDRMALTVPAFIPHCTQFAVEFAGDYVTQDAAGNVTAGVPDGRIDFVRTGGAANPVYLTRWYGFPRDTDGDGQVKAFWAGHAGFTTNNDLVDVVPLRDVLATIGVGPLAFERDLPTQPSTGYYTDPAAATHVLPNDQYRCAWGPSQENLMPKMVRFVMTVEDPAGRVPDGQTVEYVFKLH